MPSAAAPWAAREWPPRTLRAFARWAGGITRRRKMRSQGLTPAHARRGEGGEVSS